MAIYNETPEQAEAISQFSEPELRMLRRRLAAGRELADAIEATQIDRQIQMEA